MRSIKHIWCFLVMFFASTAFIAQDLSTYSFNELYDFPEKTIYSLVQDNVGNYWIGTSNGLYKFNGSDFTRFVYDGYELEYSNIKVDDFGRVWCSNFGGQLFYCKDDSLHLAMDKTIDNQFIANYSIVGENAVWFYSLQGKNLFRLNISNKSIQVIDSCDSFHAYTAWSQKGDRLFLFETYNHDNIRTIYVNKYDMKSTTKEVVDSVDMNLISSKEDVVSCNNEYLYFQHHDYLEVAFFSAEAKPKYFKDYTFKSSALNNYEGMDDQIFLLGTNASYKLLISEDSISFIPWCSIKNCSNVFKDHEGNTWISTLDRGIYISPNHSFENTLISNQTEINKVLSIGPKEFVFSNRDGELFQMDEQGARQKIDHLSIDNPNYAIGHDQYNQLLLFPSSKTGYSYSKDKLFEKKTQNYFKRVFCLDENIKIYTGENAEVYSEDPKTTIADIRYSFDYNSIDNSDYFRGSTSIDRCDLITEDVNKENLYINTNEGVLHFEKKNPKHLLYFEEKPILASAMETSENGVWISSTSGNLHLVKQGEIIHTKYFDQLVSDIVSNDSLVFCNTNKGIIRYNWKNNTQTLIDATDGLIHENIVKLFLIENQLWVWGTHTLQKIPVSYNYLNTTPPRVNLTSIAINDKPTKKWYNLILEYNENNIEFRFNALAIRSQKNVIYKYRIQELSNTWTITDYEVPFARYSQLTPGKYTFELMACNEDGICSEISSMSFEIDKHFTGKWWFIALVVLGIILIAGFFISLRIKDIKKQTKFDKEKESLKKEAYKAKITAIRSQMNPHFMFNALNTIQEFIVTKQSSIASEYLADFADLMRKYLDQSKENEITLQDELETIKIYLRLESLRFDGKFTYDIQLDETIDTYGLKIPVMLIQPFVENSIKHGLLHKEGNKHLTISFSQNKGVVVISIQDNGIGRSASALINKNKSGNHLSFASSAMEQRTELINKTSASKIQIKYEDLKDANEKSMGTKVIIFIENTV